MTEYTSSPDAVQEYMTAKERTARWIRQYPPSEFYSPSAPPSERGDLDNDDQSHTAYDSDAESARSVPPKMLLKYGDGRPDIHISHWHYDDSAGVPLSRSGSRKDTSRPQPHGSANPPHRRSRSEQPELRSGSRYGQPIDSSAMQFPEEIRVLPSQLSNMPTSTSTHTTPHRSRSQPRPAYGPSDTPAPALPYSHAPHTQGPYPPIHTPAPRHISHAPQVAYSQSHPMYRPKDAYASRYAEDLPHHQRSPPSLVYAPNPHSKSHHAPPTILHHPQAHGAPGMPYGQNAPGSRYPHTGVTPFPSVHGGLRGITENMLPPRSQSAAPRARASSKVHKSSKLARSPSRSSEESANTYYVMPPQGQKVQIVAPDQSLYTATSTTQSPSPPQSGTGKRPFFSRFFGFGGGDKSAASPNTSSRSSSSRRLQRRHSTGTRGRPALPIPTR